MEYLIKTYTNEGETVLDNCMGSGTTGVACKNLNRKFIGIEKTRLILRLHKIELLQSNYSNKRRKPTTIIVLHCKRLLMQKLDCR